MPANVKNVNFLIHARIGNKYEVFEHGGSYYINAPIDDSEASSIDSPTCVYIMDVDECFDDYELYLNALHASEECDRLIIECDRNA